MRLNRFRWRAVATTAALLMPPNLSLAAADENGPAPLSLADAVAEARAANPDLAAARAGVEVARQRPAQERALEPPMLAAQIWQWPVRTLDPRRTAGYMLMAEQHFPGRRKRGLREAVASAGLTVRERELEAESWTLVEAVTQAYTELSLARSALDIYRATLPPLEQIGDGALVRYAAGRAAHADVLQPIVEISRVHDRLLEEEERAALAQARLNRWLGRPVERPIGRLEPLPDRHLAVPVGELQRLALRHQPALGFSPPRARLPRRGWRQPGPRGALICPCRPDTW